MRKRNFTCPDLRANVHPRPTYVYVYMYMLLYAEISVFCWLLQAFVDDVVSPVNDEKLAARVRQKVEGLLPKSSSGQIHRHHMFRGGDGGG